ncbi:hypothetical protein HYX12_00930 [Candidatus Woesearchaeota archaeon]|nr:hypothetical protein [Candidatus Woesearchaeota archaeon]
MKQKTKKILKSGMYPLVIAIATVLVLTLFSLFYRYPSVGDAIISAPEEPLDLISQQAVNIDVLQVTSWEVELETSSLGDGVYRVEVVVHDDNTLKYELLDSGTVLAAGLLGGTVAHTEGIFIDEDTTADVKFSYNPANKILSITNPLYIVPSVSEIELLDDQGKVITKPKIAFTGNEYQFTLTVSSNTTKPTVDVYFAENSEDRTLTTEEKVSTENSITYLLNWTPQQMQSANLIVSADVGGQVTEKSYLFAVDGLLYHLVEEGMPEVNMFLVENDTLDVEYITSAGKIPLALPCTGTVGMGEGSSTSTIPGLSVIYGYDAGKRLPQQWIKGVPSDFYFLEGLHGYLFKLDNSADFRFSCTLSSGLPSLQQGWNLVGISGYAAAPFADLKQKVPPGARIKEQYLLGSNEAYISLSEEALLYPGRAYWIFVE